MTTMTINDGNNANAAAANAGAAAHHQSNKDIEARLAGVEALLDQSARTIKTLHGASFFQFNQSSRLSADLLADSSDLDLALLFTFIHNQNPNTTTLNNSGRRALRGQAACAD